MGRVNCINCYHLDLIKMAVKLVLLYSVFVAIGSLVCGSPEDFYGLKAKDTYGKEVDFSQYRGNVLLIVNVASQCGFTDGHYRALKKLHDILGYNKKFNILAFPCNQFGGQEPGAADEIRDVAFNTYKVDFTLMDKVDVFGPGAHPVWKHLVGASSVQPEWNFYKYLIDHHGHIVQVWPSRTPVEDIFDAVASVVKDAEEGVIYFGITFDTRPIFELFIIN